mgnify:CR=1 FL=1
MQPPCLVKIPLYSLPSRFQSAFIISFLKNPRAVATAAPPLLAPFLSHSLSLSFSPFRSFSSLTFYISFLFHLRSSVLCVPSTPRSNVLVSPTNEHFFFFFFSFFFSVIEYRFFQSRIPLHSRALRLSSSYTVAIVLRCEFGDSGWPR